MYRNWLVIPFIGLCSFLMGPTLMDPCRVYGVIYVAPEPERVDFYIYEETTEAFADILIFEEENQLFADRSGIWFFTEKRSLADFTVYFVEERRDSHFSVYFTESDTFAGCK